MEKNNFSTSILNQQHVRFEKSKKSNILGNRIKYLLSIFFYNLLISILVFIALLLNRKYILNEILYLIRKQYSTEHYIGEDLAIENIKIMEIIIFPIILILVSIIASFIRRKKNNTAP